MAAYVIILLSTAFCSCCKTDGVDPLRRSRVDGLNKEAFVNRYRDPQRSLALSDSALRYVQDSLPEYVDGELRAANNKAFAYFLTSDYADATEMVDLVDKLVGQHRRETRNGDIETVIAQLLRARLLQRSCRIADSYRLLYNIGRSSMLEKNSDNLLFNYAQTEYYITLLTLNFHYRNGKEEDVMTTVGEVEARRGSLKVDYAQDMALNYALAYGLQSAGESLRALDYCYENFEILDRLSRTALPGDTASAFCLYNYANTLQMAAMIHKNMPGTVTPDSVLALYDEARRCFFDFGDPYQMLGGVTSTARYALLIGDTAAAHHVLGEWRALKGAWTPFAAPKMEEGFFDVLIRSGYARHPEENRQWYEHRCELQEYIARNEEEDFALQNSLDMAHRRSSLMTAFAVTLGALLLALATLTVLLWASRRRLRREKEQLQEAKRRDVERIANVETCLSVLRHDVSPFMGYLRNPALPEELRGEVLEQLLRTFDNIKNWTSLSIPTGLAFRASRFALQEVFDDVRRQVAPPHNGVELRFMPTKAILWGDRLLATILLRNLVNNALQHTEQGSVRVEGDKGAEDDFVEIRISDTGCGMTAEQQENLFKADRTLAPGSEHGFGLILCRYIVKKHDDHTRRGCKLWVESEPGTGTTMHVLLARGESRQKGETHKGHTQRQNERP
ncbi:MAG: DUF5112 domain-containing protein [Bacteroidales bacterium]|nr:DUF5112 domain-containing protein [Bacteroidales bacterium]